MIPEWHFAGRQITGDRSRQEDAHAFMGLGAPQAGEYDPLLAIVSDGMGGYSGGDIASNLAVNAFTDEAAKRAPNTQKQEPWADLFLRALQRANADISTESTKVGTTGCTVICAVIERNRLHWVSVGDSALLLYRSGTLTRLNADHSLRTLTREKIACGEMTETEAAGQSNMLRSAITGETIDMIDMNADSFALQEGDILLLASDGLETIPQNQLTQRLAKLKHCSGGAIAQSLLNTVENLHKPQQDNTTVLCIKIQNLIGGYSPP